VYSSQSISAHTYTRFNASAFSIAYEATPIYTETQNSESYAVIEIAGLQPATGDISRIKTFMNNNGSVGTWELINDVELDETEIFVASTASLYPDKSIGTFVSQSTINTYWEVVTYQGRTVATAPVLTWTTASISNAMRISSSVDISNTNAVTIAKIKSSYAGVFTEGSSYKITFDALGTRLGTQNPKISMYLSGSAVDYVTTDYFNQELPVRLGKRIGELEVATDNQRFDDYVFNFETEHTGTATLLVVVESGEWQVADIRCTSDNDAGYTPDYTRLKSLVPTAHKINNQLSFKVEYYNVAGVKSKQINYINNINWQGGNRYVDGDYSMLTGSLYIADTLESGIALTGNSSTGFARSLGYKGFDSGFPGFLLWSGSALAGQTSKGLPYSGVGLELYANTSSYFRYSTRDNSIDVRTDSFFFGNPATTFISGSNGLLEISSSNFWLKSNGDLTASNADFAGTAQASVIRNKVVTVTAANSSSYLQLVSDSGTPGAFGYEPYYYNVVLDGSLGGQIIQHIKIGCPLRTVTVAAPVGTYIVGIAGIKLPGIASGQKGFATIEISGSGIYFRDDIGGFNVSK
jgi:hypothetical protein